MVHLVTFYGLAYDFKVVEKAHSNVFKIVENFKIQKKQDIRYP